MPPTLPAEVTAKLRRQALLDSPALPLRNPAFRDVTALAVLMETGYEKAVVTLVAMIDGGASIYFSSGGGIIGGEGHNAVRIAARRFTQFAGIHLPDMSRCTGFRLAEIGHVIFYVVARNAVFTQSASEKEIASGAHSFSPLFFVGQGVITQLRLATQKEK